jgi:hypothetical protein
MSKPNITQISIFSDAKSFAEINFDQPEHQGISLIKRSSILQEPISQPALVTTEYTFPFKVNNGVGVTAPLGLVIISGSTKVGKSSFLRALGIQRFLAVEPPDSLEELQQVRMFNSADAALAAAVHHTGTTGELVALDSLREPLFEIAGAAGSKGIIMSFFTALTRVSNSLARSGITMVATINPMDRDTDYVKAFIDKLDSSAAMYIHLSNYDYATGVYTGTIAERNDRVEQPFTYDSKSPKGIEAEQVDFALPQPSEDALSVFNNKQLHQLQEDTI